MDTYPGRRLGTDQPHYPGSDCHAFQESLCRGFPGGSVVENPPANAGDMGSIPGWGDPLEKEMATHSSILAWETP